MFTQFQTQLAKTGQTQFFIRVIPNAARSYVKEKLADDSIKIAIKAQAEHGKANQAVRVFLAQQFDVHTSCVQIVSGITSRHKLIRIVQVVSGT